MKLLDANVLNARETVAFSWIVLLAFVRLSTKVGLFPSPLPVRDALDQVGDWLGAPTAAVVEPGPRHLDVPAELLSGSGTGGNLTNDAHLAALALEHRCVVVTYDRDFGRFDGVRWSPPTVA